MQGKACFNFTKVDEPLMQELEALSHQPIKAARCQHDDFADHLNMSRRRVRPWQSKVGGEHTVFA